MEMQLKVFEVVEILQAGDVLDLRVRGRLLLPIDAKLQFRYRLRLGKRNVALWLVHCGAHHFLQQGVGKNDRFFRLRCLCHLRLGRWLRARRQGSCQ